MSPLESVRQEAARHLVESLGYPPEELASNVPIACAGEGSYIADLVVKREDSDQPLIVVEVAAPGSRPPEEVPAAIAGCDIGFYFWFDGFGDAPNGKPSWGTRYFQREDGAFRRTPSLPHHHRKLKPRKRRPVSKRHCPSCDAFMEQACLVPCTDDCPGWSCMIFRMLRCPACNTTVVRTRPERSKAKD